MHLSFELGARFRDGRKRVYSLPRTTSVDDGPIVLVGRTFEHRVEGRAPRAPDEVDVVGRVTPGTHRPDDVEHAGGVDILVHDHRPSARVVARVTIGRQHGRLFRVTRVELLDGNDVEEP